MIYAAAVGAGTLDPGLSATLIAAVVVSMAITPLSPMIVRRFLPHDEISMEGIEEADGLAASALIVGFGRFGQVASQALLARGIDVSIIDRDTEMIRSASRFGFKIYYGDGSRLDVLRAAGAAHAKIIAICIDDREAVNKMVEIAKAEFPMAKVLARSYDRAHTIALVQAGVDFEIRETFESANEFSAAALIAMGLPDEEAREVVQDVRNRDLERLELQLAGDFFSGRELLHGNQPIPQPLTPPRREPQALTPETEAAVREGDDAPPPPPPVDD